VKTAANAAAQSDPINEQCRSTACCGKIPLNDFVAVNQIGAIDFGIGDLHHRNRIVGLFRLVDGKYGVGRICTEIVLARFIRPLLLFKWFKIPWYVSFPKKSSLLKDENRLEDANASKYMAVEREMILDLSPIAFDWMCTSGGEKLLFINLVFSSCIR
jgi:hypothetical protein